MTTEIDDELTKYFRGLGYIVTWDCRGLKRWYEILDGDTMVCQIDFGVPLAHILQDIPLLAEGKPATSSSDYLICVDDDTGLDDLKLIARRIRINTKRRRVKAAI